MNSFSHTVIRHGTVKVRRDGRKLRIAIEGEGLSRITVEIQDGELIVLDPAVLDPDTTQLPEPSDYFRSRGA